MKFFNFPLAELHSKRLRKLCKTLGCSEAETLGVVLWFWVASRDALVEEGSAETLADCLPAMGVQEPEQAVLKAMAQAGYLETVASGHYRIVDNIGFAAKSERVRAQCTKAAAARNAITKARAEAPRVKQPRKAVPPALVAADPPAQAANRATWEAYAASYLQKMGQPPVRNAKSNSLIKQFVQRIGAGDAPHVLAFFVEHPNEYYMQRLYQLEMAVRDAESLRTQWANGIAITKSDIKQLGEQLSIERDRQRILLGR